MKELNETSENTTFESIPTFIPKKYAINTASFKDHSILCQGPSFICQNIFNLSQILTDSCAEKENSQVKKRNLSYCILYIH